MNWHTLKIADLADVASGGGAPQSAGAFGTEGTPFVRAGSLPKLLQGAPEESLELLSTDVAAAHKLKRFPAGTILFAKSGMSATKGHIYQLKQAAYVVNHLAALTPKSELDGDYLKHVLKFKSPKSLIKDEAYPSIRLSDIKEMELPAPKDEAKRNQIVAILDRADELHRKRQNAIKCLNQLSQAIFHEMFGNPVTNEKGWRRVPLGDLLSSIESGWSPVCEDRQANHDEWGVLKLGAVTWGTYDETKNKALPSNFTPRPDVEVKQGDLLFARKNTKDLVAASAYVSSTRGKLMMPDLVFRLVIEKKAPLDKIFLWRLLSEAHKKRSIQQLAGGAAGSMPNISKKKLLAVDIELPPLDLQSAFAARFRGLMSLQKQMGNSLDDFEGLLSALQTRVFQGGILR